MKQGGFQEALHAEHPLQIVGTINAYTALLAKNAGFRAIYLSGSGVAAASFGLPDLGITNATDVAEDVRRITSVCDLPLLVDIDTGFGNALVIARTIKMMIKAGAAAAHIEDQVQAKRCGHRPKKQIVSQDEMCDRIKAAIDAKTNSNFILMARTDALAIEGLEKTIERLKAYVDAGAEMIFLEGAKELSHYTAVKKAISVPLLANITEFGVTPLFTKEELKTAEVDMILYPLSAFRAMSKAALQIYETIRQTGTQRSVLENMQTREEFYRILDYYRYEQDMDELLDKGIKQ